jgi:ketosteroid isomerase-like protein
VSDVIASGDRAVVQFVVREFSTRLGRDLLSEQVVVMRAAQGRIVNIVGYYDSSEFRRVFWEES